MNKKTTKSKNGQKIQQNTKIIKKNNQRKKHKRYVNKNINIQKHTTQTNIQKNNT